MDLLVTALILLLFSIDFLKGNLVMIFIDLFANIPILVLILSQVGQIVHLFNDLKLKRILLNHLPRHDLLQINHPKHS